MKRLFISLVVFNWLLPASAQECSTLDMQHVADIPSECGEMVMTMQHDIYGLPNLYIANKEAGLTIYDIGDPATPFPVSSVPISEFDDLHVMNLIQQGNYIFLALGNHFTDPQPAGLAIVDVSIPQVPVVTDYIVLEGSGSGAGIVVVEENTAYLGAMQSGIVLYDVSDKENIVQLNQYVPEIDFPPIGGDPNPELYNARGMEVRDGIVYLCYDAGGVRIIDCTNPEQPDETGQWCNPAMYTPINFAKAYNNIVLDGDIAYVTVDYAGLEVLDVTDPSEIELLGWWNPYNAPANNWFASPSHTNELFFDAACKQVFMATGKSDLIVVDVSDPAAPDSCNFYGGVDNGLGAWGISRWENEIYLSYICALIPFTSFVTQATIISFDPCEVTDIADKFHNEMLVYPNPASDHVRITTVEAGDMVLTDSMGRKVLTAYFPSGNHDLDFSSFASGAYCVVFQAVHGKVQSEHVIISR
jgi:hypothetical protein